MNFDEILKKILIRCEITPKYLMEIEVDILENISKQERRIKRYRKRKKNLNRSINSSYKLKRKGIPIDDNLNNRKCNIVKLIESNEDDATRLLNVYKFFGDCIAFRLYHEHDIRQLSKNKRPGFTTNNQGSNFEMDTLRYLCMSNYHAILHDITHCLRVGDVSFLDTESGKPCILECKSTKNDEIIINDRMVRQAERMNSIGKVISNEVSGKIVDLTDEEIDSFEVPSHVLISKIPIAFHSDSFNEMCNLGDNKYMIKEVERGLYYLSAKVEYFDDCKDVIQNEVRKGKYITSNLLRRVEGDFETVIPFALHSMNVTCIEKIIQNDISFNILLDVSIFLKNLSERGVNLKPILQNNEIVAFADENGNSVGIGILRKVQYGLLKLESACNMYEEVCVKALKFI